MAKVSAKPVVKKPTVRKTKLESPDIEKASRDALAKLRALDIEHQLQSDIDWCIGSFLGDGNPVGLYDMVNRSIQVFKLEAAKKTKGVTAKFISDLEKAVGH